MAKTYWKGLVAVSGRLMEMANRDRQGSHHLAGCHDVASVSGLAIWRCFPVVLLADCKGTFPVLHRLETIKIKTGRM